MKSNTLQIVIDRPVDDVFAYILEPSAIPNWTEHIADGETNEWPVRLGTMYRTKNRTGQRTHFIVTEFVKNRRLELRSGDGNFHIRYMLHPLKEHSTLLEYSEWMDTGELVSPLDNAVLASLKEILEQDVTE